MKNTEKTGKAILDKHIKFIKKKTKDTVIRPLQNDGYYLDSDLNNSVIKIKSVRKYSHRHTQWLENKEKYVYEIDVIVDMRFQGGYFYYGTNRFCQQNAKRHNKYYRDAILGAVTQELKYFGIDNREMNIVISKIEYKDIV